MIHVQVPFLSYSGHLQEVTALSWSPDSQYLATASRDGTVHVWQAQTGEVALMYTGHRDAVEALSWSPTGMYLASAGWEKTVHVWHACTGKVITIYQGHSALIRSALAWSPDGKRLASGGWDRTIHVWDALSGEASLIYRGHQSIVITVAWSPNGRLLASGGGYPEAEIQVWQAETGTRNFNNQEMYGSVRGLAWLPDSRSLAAVRLHKEVQRLAFDTGKVLTNYALGEITDSQDRHVAGTNYGWGNLVCSPDGMYLATPTHGTTWAIWEADTGRNVAVYTTPTCVLAWSPDGKYIACAHIYQPIISIWQVAS